MTLSVLVPVYGVEDYIERCARSLFEQTLEDIEYVFVDDCTPDRSMEILHNVLEEYPHRKSQVKILHNKTNLGIAKVRDILVSNATADYVIACDSDDWVEPNMYEEMWKKQQETGADIVQCNRFENRSNNFILEKKVNHCASPLDRFKDFNSSTNYLWDKLIRKSILIENNIRALHPMYEDFCVMLQVMYHAKSIAYVDKCLYHYNLMNSGSLTHRYMSIDKARGAKANYDLVENFFKERNFDWGTLQYPAKLNVRNFYLKVSPMPWDEWRNTFPEIVPALLNDKSKTLVYRWSYYLAHIGFTLPMSMLKYLPSWKLMKAKLFKIN